jgi:hypothetical protein
LFEAGAFIDSYLVIGAAKGDSGREASYTSTNYGYIEGFLGGCGHLRGFGRGVVIERASVSLGWSFRRGNFMKKSFKVP